MFLSIVIAIYNEEDNVEELTNRIYDSMNQWKIPFELIYVIDGKDNSYPILKKLKESKQKKGSMHYIKNNMTLDHSPDLRGFKNAFLKGFSLADKKATHFLTMDGDLNHQPEEIKIFIDHMSKTNSDIVIGSRYIYKGKIEKLALWKKSISLFANFIIKLLWNLEVQDKTSGYRLYKKQVIDKVLPLCKSNNFEFLLEILILAKRLKYNLSEVPIIFKARERGESKFALFRTIYGYIKLVFKYFLKF